LVNNIFNKQLKVRHFYYYCYIYVTDMNIAGPSGRAV